MKVLKELAEYVSRHQLINYSSLSFLNADDNSKFGHFLRGVSRGTYEDDESAATALYKKGTEDIRYRVLKNRLKQRLYNAVLLFQPARTSSTYADVYASLYRQLVVCKLLISSGARKAGYELLGKILAKAEKHQLYDIMQQCTLHFRRYTMMLGDTKQFEKYNEKFHAANQLLLQEARAEELYCRVMIHFNQSFSQSRGILNLVEECLSGIREIKKTTQTFQVNFYANSVETTYAYLVRDYEGAIRSCEEFENYLSQNPVFYSPARKAVLLSEKAGYYLHLGKFNEGIVCAREAMALHAEGSINWFLLLELYFLLLLNSGDLKGATELYLSVVNHNRFTYTRPQQQELWKVFGGYLYFLLLNRDEEECLEMLNSRKERFRFSTLINDIPIFARDKQGMNVAVLILQILLFLQSGDYPKIISRTEALKSYIYRNLDKDSHRSHYFIKMLLALEKGQFDPEKIIPKTEKNLSKLREENLDYTATQARMEILPYERLWEITLSILDANTKK
jgi:hypothetical protein